MPKRKARMPVQQWPIEFASDRHDQKSGVAFSRWMPFPGWSLQSFLSFSSDKRKWNWNILLRLYLTSTSRLETIEILSANKKNKRFAYPASCIERTQHRTRQFQSIQTLHHPCPQPRAHRNHLGKNLCHLDYSLRTLVWPDRWPSVYNPDYS